MAAGRGAQTRQSAATVVPVPYSPNMSELEGRGVTWTEETAGTEVTVEPGSGRSLSPSRAGDFLTCPLLYRFRCIDRLPEPPTPAAVRGTLVHAVLERLFDLPAAQRSLPVATELLRPEWERLLAGEPALANLFSEPQEYEAWLDSAKPLLAGYFSLEDPSR